jgi:8-oxo-dGTP pyrophosphatase MutT (NUDIX family)
MSERDFHQIREEVLHEGRIFDLVRGTFRFPDGEEAVREYVVSPGAVGIVAHDDDVVYLVRQPREPVGEPDVLEIPAGRLDKEGEPPVEAAKRELEEEIGYHPKRIESLRSYWSSVGMTNERVELFLATDLVPCKADSGEMERIEIVRWPLADLDAAITAVQDVKTLLGLVLLRERLQAR